MALEQTAVVQQADSSQEPASPGPGISPSVIHEVAAFFRFHLWKILSVSILVLIPCFWQKHIGFCDMASHVYNAWLASLIQHGQAPGLYLVHQWNDVLFDILLTRLGILFGWLVAEKIAVSLSVLTFFWGAFAFITVASRRAPWFLIPAIAMVTYGWTFQIGFMNYYLGIGLALLGCATLWRARGVGFLLGAIFLFLAFLAHPLGFIFFVTIFAYIRFSNLLSGWWKFLPFALSLAAVFLFGAYLIHRYNGQPLSYNFLLNGVDQLVLSSKYRLLAAAILCIGAVCFLVDATWNGRNARYWQDRSIPLSLYVISYVATFVLPDSIWLPQYPFPVTQLVMRLTLVCAIFALCILGSLRLRVWHLAVFSAAAAFFFAFFWSDTAKLNAMETQAEQLVRKVPQNSRVLATIWPLPGSRLFFINHLVDRACIGHCFSFSNYEAPSVQYRLRALPGNSFETTSVGESDEMQSGTYVVQPRDLPIYQIEQCTPVGTRLCIEKLHVGEPNGTFAVHPTQ